MLHLVGDNPCIDILCHLCAAAVVAFAVLGCLLVLALQHLVLVPEAMIGQLLLQHRQHAATDGPWLTFAGGYRRSTNIVWVRGRGVSVNREGLDE